MKKILLFLLFLFPLPPGLLPQAFAYNFLYINPTTGAPIGWEPGTTIEYYVDPGSLGRLTNEQARTLIQAAMDIWTNASPDYANVPRFHYAGLLPEDVNGTNYSTYVNKHICYKGDSTTCEIQTQTDQKTVIIFDQDGSILDALCGGGFTCAGVALPNVFSGTSSSQGIITGGFVVFSGTALNTLPPAGQSINSLAGLMVHELGHLLGLAHTSINQEPYILGQTGFDRYSPTMFFTSVPGSIGYTEKTSVTLNPDDIAGITTLYPSTTASANLGTISGQILKSDGSPMEHVNVIARNVSDPLCEAYSFLSGRQCQPSVNPSGDPICIEDNSNYNMFGLPSGSYSIEVEEIANTNIALNFTPLLTSPQIYGDAEFWNTDDAVDELNTLSSTLSIAAGETKENINITLNRSTVTADRIKYIPLNTFTADPGTRCPTLPPVDYAALIGTSEAGITGSSESGGNSGTAGSGSSNVNISSTSCSLIVD